MNPSHHIHIGPAFRAALVASALLLAAKSAGLAADRLCAFDPGRASAPSSSSAAVEFPRPPADFSPA